MKNVEITKQGIVIIQWLKWDDPQLGEVLFRSVKHKELERENYFVKFYEVYTKAEFVAAMQELIYTTEEGTLFTLHIVAHGNEDLIGIDADNNIQWGELFKYTRQLNITMGNNLLLVLSSCVGGGILSHIEPQKRAPYRAVIANTRDVMMEDAHKGFAAFYTDYFNILDFAKSLEALNKSIDFSKEIESGREKREFFIMTAEQSFDAVFNPDRDPANFRKLVNTLTFSNSEESEERKIANVKEALIALGERLKPYFTFKDLL